MEILVLRPSHSVMSGAFLAGYLHSMRLWANRKPVPAYLIEGRAAPGIPVYYVAQFQGAIDERELGTAKAPEIGTLSMKDGDWHVVLRVDPTAKTRPQLRAVA